MTITFKKFGRLMLVKAVKKRVCKPSIFRSEAEDLALIEEKLLKLGFYDKKEVDVK